MSMGYFLNYDARRQDESLDYVRTLSTAYPQDSVVREHLAWSLLQGAADSHYTFNLLRQDALVDEIGIIALEQVEYPEELWKQFAIGLEKMFFRSYNDRDDAVKGFPRAKQLTKHLRTLSKKHNAISEVRQRFAWALAKMLGAERDFDRCDALLAELRELAEAHREDAAVRRGLAAGLVNTLNAAKTENDLAHRDALLDELRALARAHGEDEGVRKQLAKGLVNMFNDAKAEGDLDRHDALLDELRALAESYLDDAFVLEVWQCVAGREGLIVSRRSLSSAHSRVDDPGDA